MGIGVGADDRTIVGVGVGSGEADGVVLVWAERTVGVGLVDEDGVEGVAAAMPIKAVSPPRPTRNLSLRVIWDNPYALGLLCALKMAMSRL